jgi:hypothetical protein
MTDGGYWITDYHALFTVGSAFRPGRWTETTTQVHRGGELAFSGAAGVTVAEVPLDDAPASSTVRALRAGAHPVYVAVHDAATEPLALMVRTGSAPVVGFVPALFENQPMPAPPMLPLLRVRSSRLIVGAGDLPDAGEMDASDRGVRMLGDRALVVHVGDEREVRSWFGLDVAGDVAAFVLDMSGGLLREFHRAQPSASDPRRIRNSCPRIVTDEASLVRRLESLIAKNLIELEPDTDPPALARAFFAQPNGNLRSWLCDEAEGVAEVYYSD